MNALKIFGQYSVKILNIQSAKLSTKTKVSSPKQIPIISSRRKEFNLYRADFVESKSNAEFGSIPLASNGWRHHKSKGDFFILHPNEISSHQLPETNTVEQLGIDRQILDNLKARHENLHPTYIQQESIPVIMQGDHTLIAAETGCGKTYCYLLPILQSIMQIKANAGENRNFNSPLAVILTPGRELASQIAQVAEEISENLHINVQCILGGRTKLKITNPSFNDVDLLIGSFGAVSKLVTTGIYRMDQTRHVVLDEADTMLDDSFNDKLTHFLSKFPVTRPFVGTSQNGNP
jgi:ATP-dependent RNA helicase DDX28